MDRSIDDANIDAAAEDPPLLPLATAVLGILLAVAGIVWLVASLFVVLPIPVGNPFLAILLGFVVFVGSMIAWNPTVRWM